MADLKGFTRRELDRLPAPKRERWITDHVVERGGGRLLVRLHPSGTKNFYFRYFLKGTAQLIPMGPYTSNPMEGYLTLEQAREKARHYSGLYRDPHTRDVRAAVLPKSEAIVTGSHSLNGETSVESPTMLALCHAYVDHLDAQGKTATARNYRNQLSAYIATSEWAELPAGSLTMEGVTALLRTIVERGLRRTPGQVRSLLNAAYGLAIRARSDPTVPKKMLAFGITKNPISATASLTDLSQPRKRALTSAELGHLWLALTSDAKSSEVGYRLVRLGLLLGGQRVAQLHGCLRKNVDLDRGTLLLHDPKGRRKIPREHLLPLTPGALAEVLWFLDVSKSLGSAYLIPGTAPDQPMEHGAELHVITRLCKRLIAEERCKDHFHHQDLRRSATTEMAAIGISKDIRCQIQSHGMGDVESRHYDMHTYLNEKRDALVKWEAHLTKLAEEAAQAKSSSSIKDK